MTLEQVHHCLSDLPARFFGFANRGAMTKGMAADSFIYALDKLGFEYESHETRTTLPDGDWRRVCEPHGIGWVIVNGEPIFHDIRVPVRSRESWSASRTRSSIGSRLPTCSWPRNRRSRLLRN